MKINLLGPRGLLFNHPADVVCVIDGNPITKADVLQAKRERQGRQLAAKRRDYDPLIKPCFVHVFWTNGLGEAGFYRGWWLYINTLHASWNIGPNRDSEIALKAMRLFPCGYLPMIENFNPWKEAFADMYHRPTLKRPDKQGMAIAWAKVSAGGWQLLDISCK